jgi:hypothetical protein
MTHDPDTLEAQAVEHADRILDVRLDREGLPDRRRRHTSLFVMDGLEDVPQFVRERLDVFARKTRPAVKDESMGAVSPAAARDRSAGDLNGEGAVVGHGA